MKTVFVITALGGLALILFALLCLGVVNTAVGCEFLARVTIIGIICTAFSCFMLLQNAVIRRIRNMKK